MSFRLGTTSDANCVGVDRGIVACAHHAIFITAQDFGVYEGLRTRERQRALVLAGASRTMDSFHIADAQGVGHALDLVPYVLGRLQWQMPCCNVVARAMRTASIELKVPLTWGRVWDRLLHELDPDNFEHERWLYVRRYQASHPPVLVNGKPIPQVPLDDGPHFQGLRVAVQGTAKVEAA